jgi:pimeloyl-ACP methyl ester carboxylesterase
MSHKQVIVHVNNVDLNVIDSGGNSPALVFLHYWGGSSRTWAPVIALLSNTHRCVAIDFRGWGQSSKQSDDYSLQTLASDVIGVVEKLGLNEFFLLGHSMGGKVAQLVAARHPQGLKGLILFAPAPPTPLAVPEADRKGYVSLYQSREGVEMVMRNLTPHPLPEAFREQIIEDTLAGALAAKRAWPLQGMIADISKEVAGIAVPLHIIAGGDDAVEPAASLRAAFGKTLHDVHFTVIPGVGHMAPLEAPAELARAIRSAQTV